MSLRKIFKPVPQRLQRCLFGWHKPDLYFLSIELIDAAENGTPRLLEMPAHGKLR